MFAALLAARARARPDGPAVGVAGGETLTFGAWDRRSDAAGQGLRGGGVGPGDRVALCVGSTAWIDHAIAYAAVHKAGAVPVLVGERRSPLAVAAAARRAGAVAAIVPGPASGPGPGTGSGWPWSAPVAVLEAAGGAEDPLATVATVAHFHLDGGPLAGTPPRARPAAHLVAAPEGLAPASEGAGEVLLHAVAPSTDAGARYLWWAVGGDGPAPVVALAAFDPEVWCRLSATYPAATWLLTPVTAHWLLASGRLRDHHLDGRIRTVLLEGRPGPGLLEALGRALPGARIVSVAPEPEPEPEPGTGPGLASAGPGEGEGAAPASASQVGMLWHEQFSPGSQNLPPLVRRYRGPLDVAALEAALAEIVRRHEPLRTTYTVRGGRPVQRVAPAGDRPLEVLDLSGLDPAQRDTEVSDAVEDARRPFDLGEGPLFEARLIRLAADDHLVVLRVHHSVFDDASVSVFRRELSALYRSFTAGEASPLAPLALGYSTFARNQDRRLAGPAGQAELAWWKQHLAGAPLALQLPIADPGRPPGSPQASPPPVSVELPADLSAQLRALARRERTTVFMTMLAAFQVLVQHRTGQSELLAASVVAHRNRPELEAMIGCFTKKVPVRLDGGGDPSFCELLVRVRSSLLASLTHQDLPFETVLQEALGAAAATHGLVPTVAVMFQGVTPQVDDVVLPGLATSGYDTAASMARTHFAAGGDRSQGAGGAGDGAGKNSEEGDGAPWGGGLYNGTFLILSVIEGSDRLSLAARGAFHRPSVVGLLADFEVLLTDIAAHPTRPISRLRVPGTPEHDGGGRSLDLRGFRVDGAALEAALGSHPAIDEVAVDLDPQAGGGVRLVARAVPAGGEVLPSQADVQAFLWSRLPGCAVPALVDPAGRAGGEGARHLPEAEVLAGLWPGAGPAGPGANYWQRFSFLDALHRGREQGVMVGDGDVVHHRTLANLAASVAARRSRHRILTGRTHHDDSIAAEARLG
ncbi:MAG TPA: condensation domain-containing protein [Acidimicrobiales bacterium]|nr:condensation domain-containing protein [Acidimicrobiales bacterium]